MISAGAVLIAILGIAARMDGVVLVATDSSCPVGIYRIVDKPVVRGELVEACLPDALARYGMARGYIHSGNCSNGSEPVIKIIGAMAGDGVELSPTAVRVNRIFLPKSASRTHDSRGRQVRTIQRGSYKTEPDHVWLFGLNDSRSWDSRYFGPVPARNVLGAIEPLLTLNRFSHPDEELR